MKIIKLPVFDILINIAPNGAGGISSSLDAHENTPDVADVFEGILSLVLAHACAGVDIETPSYLEGIETAVEAAAK